MSMEFQVIVESSARHVHLSTADLEALFGKGYELHNKRALSQPGQYLTEEKVTLVGPRSRIERVSVLGPVRSATQVEISFTDARTLGIDAPIRESGDIAGTPGIKIVGPAGEVDIKEGVIVAKRHIHVHTSDAEKYNLKDKQIVSLEISGPRSVVFNDCVVRVSDNFSTAVHIDYDEANAAGIKGEVTGIIRA